MNKQTFYVKPPFIKLDSFLKFCGIAETGGHAKEIVAEGICLVNGVKCFERGKKLVDGDFVQIDDNLLEVKFVED